MAHLSDRANLLREEYFNKYGLPPRCWSHGEETMAEYEDYLYNEINHKIIAKYKYLGGESTSDLIIDKNYNRIGSLSEFRIIDESGGSYLYSHDNFKIILDRKIKIVKSDITEMEVDAIVNAANNSLLRGSGVCGAIFSKAGYELDKECHTIGNCNTGEAVITNGYNLKAKHIIHTVAPRWFITRPTEEKNKLFRNCYHSIFKIAIENNIKTIAIPCIGTGIYQCPIELGRNLAFEEASIFIEHFNSIYFVCFGEKEFEIYESGFRYE